MKRSPNHSTALMAVGKSLRPRKNPHSVAKNAVKNCRTKHRFVPQ